MKAERPLLTPAHAASGEEKWQVSWDRTARGMTQIKASESTFWANEGVLRYRRPCFLGQLTTNSSMKQGRDRHLETRPRHDPCHWWDQPCSPNSRVWQPCPNMLFSGDGGDCWGPNQARHPSEAARKKMRHLGFIHITISF